jgi:hypothetical protein
MMKLKLLIVKFFCVDLVVLVIIIFLLLGFSNHDALDHQPNELAHSICFYICSNSFDLLDFFTFSRPFSSLKKSPIGGRVKELFEFDNFGTRCFDLEIFLLCILFLFSFFGDSGDSIFIKEKYFDCS